MMDEMNAFEQQIADELGQMAGPGRRIDAMAMVRTIAIPSSRWPVTTRRLGGRNSPTPIERGFSMISALKFIAAGVIVALFGGLLLVGLPMTRQEQPAPAAESASVEPTYVAPVPVTGTMNADAEGIEWGPADDVTQLDDRVSHPGGGTTWTFEVSDPRLSGVAYELRNMDMIGPKYQYHEGEIFVGTIELVNADGSWMGSLRGYATMGPAMRRWHIELTGTGGYEGLSALLEAVGPYGSAELEGLVFPGALPGYPDPVDVSVE